MARYHDNRRCVSLTLNIACSTKVSTFHETSLNFSSVNPIITLLLSKKHRESIMTWVILVSYYKSSSVCLFVCLSVCSLSPPRSFDRSSPNLVGVCRWTSELPLRGSFSKRSMARRVNGSLSLSTILYMCQPHSTQLQKATLLLLHPIRLKGTFCCIDGWWVYVGGSRNCLLTGNIS